MSKLIQLMAIAAATIIVSILVEIGFRLISDSQEKLMNQHNFKADRAAEPDVKLGYRLKKSYSVAGFRQNSLGFIGDEFKKEKKNKFRIICIGGSTTLGTGAEKDSFSYPALLQEIFKRCNLAEDRVEVINAGVFGYHSHHSRIRLEAELLEYAPDVIIVMDGLNDLVAANKSTDKEFEKIKNDSANVNLLSTNNAFQSYVALLASRSYAVRWAMSLNATTTKNEELSEKLAAFGFENNLKSIANTAQRSNISLLLVSYPWKVAEDITFSDMKMPKEHFLLYKAGRAIVPGVVKRVAEETGSYYFDPQNTFDAETKINIRRVWSDDIHFTRYGNFLLAKNLYSELVTKTGVLENCGKITGASFSEIDAKFPEIMTWKSTDGSGWASDANLLKTKELETINIKDSPKNDSGWSCYTTDSQLEHGIIKAKLNVPRRLGVYARINHIRDAITITEMAKDGSRRKVFELIKQVDDDIWTPESEWFEIDLHSEHDDEKELIIELKGENAQLWHKGPSIFAKIS